MTPNFCTLIFDLDGTLADTLPLIYEAFNDALGPALGRELTPGEIRALFGPPDNYLIRSLVEPIHQQAAIDRYVATYERRHRDLVELFDGIADLLTDARAAGNRLAVVTGKSRVTALMTLDMLGVLDRFDVIYAGDDVERQKPESHGAGDGARRSGARGTRRRRYDRRFRRRCHRREGRGRCHHRCALGKPRPHRAAGGRS